MQKKSRRVYRRRWSDTVLWMSLALLLTEKADGLTINPQNVQAMAIYGEASGFGVGLQTNQIVFNVTDSSLISTMISAIEFSVERDCSSLGSKTNAYVYINRWYPVDEIRE